VEKAVGHWHCLTLMGAEVLLHPGAIVSVPEWISKTAAACAKRCESRNYPRWPGRRESPRLREHI
jgi:hypothetical protein